MHTSQITDICFLDIYQKTFQVWKRFYETFKSIYTYSCFSLLRIGKVYSLMIHKYYIHFVSVRDNHNVKCT